GRLCLRSQCCLAQQGASRDSLAIEHPQTPFQAFFKQSQLLRRTSAAKPQLSMEKNKNANTHGVAAALCVSG
ncbi:hypothetical protein, partial [Pseudomonas savastanoi]|uniref:hypothetical protein n=1 Tax=Pseudomonas savastanoi TaxID=29438 RepID=UPI0021E0C610